MIDSNAPKKKNHTKWHYGYRGIPWRSLTKILGEVDKLKYIIMIKMRNATPTKCFIINQAYRLTWR
jgi:hypothetical protein